MSNLASAIIVAAICLSLAWCTVSQNSAQSEREMFCMKQGKVYSTWSQGCK